MLYIFTIQVSPVVTFIKFNWPLWRKNFLAYLAK